MTRRGIDRLDLDPEDLKWSSNSNPAKGPRRVCLFWYLGDRHK